MDWKGFVNPYNFIGFPKEKAKAYTDEDVHNIRLQQKHHFLFRIQVQRRHFVNQMKWQNINLMIFFLILSLMEKRDMKKSIISR